MRILLIDDDALFCALIADGLGDRGHSVVVAADGAEGLERLASESFACVVCDIYMPGKEGLETMQEIRRRWPGLQIVAISASSDRDGFAPLEIALKFGASAGLQKPFEVDRLLAAIAGNSAGGATRQV